MVLSAAVHKDNVTPEARLIGNLLSNPVRQHYLALSDHCAAVGDTECAREFALGIVPDSYLDRYDIIKQCPVPLQKASGYSNLLDLKRERIQVTPPRNADSNRSSVFEFTEIETSKSGLHQFVNARIETDGVEHVLFDSAGNSVKAHSTRNHVLLAHNEARGATAISHMPGRTVALLARNGGNFYHWVVDVVTQLQYLESAGIPLKSIDRFLISGDGSGFQRATFDLLGISLDRMYFAGSGFSAFQCAELLLPVQSNRMGRALSPRSLQYLRRSLLPRSEQPVTAVKRLAVRRTRRGIANAAEVEAVLDKHGFQSFVLEELSLAEQIGLFAQADCVFAPHGAGLTHLSFCRPATRVLEIYGQQIQPCFWLVSELSGLHYTNYNFSTNTQHPEADGNRNLAQRLRSEITVDPVVLDEQLDSLLSDL